MRTVPFVSPAVPARALTLSRVVGLPPFLWLVAHAEPGHGAAWAAAALYPVLALSDFFDGPLARRAGAASPRWGRIDVAADVLFNVASLGLAAGLGLVRPWVPLGVAVLGGRFLWRSRRAGPDAPPPEDRAGKLAGVLFYLLVGAVVLQVATGAPGADLVRAAGDATFLWTVFAFWKGRRPRRLATRPA